MWRRKRVGLYCFVTNLFRISGATLFENNSFVKGITKTICAFCINHDYCHTKNRNFYRLQGTAQKIFRWSGKYWYQFASATNVFRTTDAIEVSYKFYISYIKIYIRYYKHDWCFYAPQRSLHVTWLIMISMTVTVTLGRLCLQDTELLVHCPCDL